MIPNNNNTVCQWYLPERKYIDMYRPRSKYETFPLEYLQIYIVRLTRSTDLFDTFEFTNDCSCIVLYLVSVDFNETSDLEIFIWRAEFFGKCQI